MKVDFETDVGAVRSSNQDACDGGLFSKDSAWAVVCDGMGGANGGNVASAMAVESIRRRLLEGFHQDITREGVRSLLLEAVTEANRVVYRRSQEEQELRGMGTTAVVLVASKGTLHVAHVGDSRAYLKNSQGLSQITMDHSYVQDLVNFGQITKEEARVHPAPEHHHPGAGGTPPGGVRLRQLRLLPRGHGPGLHRRPDRLYGGRAFGRVPGALRPERFRAGQEADPVRRGKGRL